MTHAYLITGASRGLGAEFVRQLRERGHTVFAAVRDPSAADEAARAGAKVVRLDVDRPETFDTFARTGFSYAYCASKSALNMLTVLMHRELAGDGITVVSFDPGWNRTDMGGAAAPLDPTDSVRAMVAILDRLRLAESGMFLGYDGQQRPW